MCNALFGFAEQECFNAGVERGALLAEALNARVFSSVWQVYRSAGAYLGGDVDQSRTLLMSALDDSAAHGIIGAKGFAQLAMVSREDDTRRQALERGREIVGTQSIGVSTLFFRFAIEACLIARDWDGLDAYLEELETYTREEPLPRSELYISRARVLSAWQRGDNGHLQRQALESLKVVAAQSGLIVASPQIVAALD